MKKILIGFAAIAAIMATSCGSTNNVTSNSSIKPASNSGVTVAGKETVVVDWDGRTLGTEATPAWLAPAVRGDFSAYIAAFKKKDGDVFRRSTGTGADVRSATMRADMAYARTIARELQQSVNVYAAEQARSGNLSDATRQAIEEVTKTQSNAEITGHQKATEYWQQVVEVDPVSGEKKTSYIVYQIYQIPANTWAQTTAKYVKQVLGGIADELSPEQDFVKGLVSEMMHDARFPTVMSQEEAKQKAEINKQMADVQASLAPAQQKAAAEQELAKIMQNAKTERTKIAADASVKKTEAVADATKAAYLSGSPVYQSAATVTGADKEWADAEALAASILFN